MTLAPYQPDGLSQAQPKLYEYRRNSAIAHGTWQPFVPAEPVRKHILDLERKGVSRYRVATLTGISHRAITMLKRPRTRMVRTENAELILAVTPATTEPLPLARVDATETHRRLQALSCLGWSPTEVERQTGTARGVLTRSLTRPQVSAETAACVAKAYDRLSMTPAPDSVPARRARLRAQKHGWVPPLAWDDEDLDDPAAFPADGSGDGRERLQAWITHHYRPLVDQGLSHREIAERDGVTGSAIAHRVRRAQESGLLTADMKPKQVPLSCGTYGAYRRHKRLGEKVCDPCQEAARIVWRRAVR